MPRRLVRIPARPHASSGLAGTPEHSYCSVSACSGELRVLATPDFASKGPLATPAGQMGAPALLYAQAGLSVGAGEPLAPRECRCITPEVPVVPPEHLAAP